MKYYLVEREGLGCFNLIIWDVLFTVAVIYAIFKEVFPNIHPIVGLFLGIIVCIILIVLMKRRIIGKIIQVIFGVGWGYLFYSIADSFIEWSKTDKVWNTFFIILFCLIGILLHFVSHTEMIGDDHEDNTAKYAYKNQSSYKETVGNYYTGNSYRTENSNEKSDTSDYQSTSNSQSKSQFNPFAGCTTKEELKIRYKQLIKSFHPDLEMGDEEAAKFLNNEYERLMEEFEM